jgi:hypothetical protein
MKQFAVACSGSYNIVHNIEDVATVFGNILGGLASCLVQRFALTITGAAEVLTHYTVQQVDNGKQIMIGDVTSAGEYTVLIRGCTSSPTHIRICGYDLQKMERIDAQIETSNVNEDTSLQAIAYAAYMRWETVELMNTVRQVCLHDFEKKADSLRKSIDDQIGRIKNIQATYEHPVLPLLLSELEECKKIVQHSYPILHEAIQYLEQHSAYYGQARGILSPHRPHYDSHYKDNMRRARSISALPCAPMKSPTIYANSLQQNMSAAMCQSVTRRSDVQHSSRDLTYSSTTTSSCIAPVSPVMDISTMMLLNNPRTPR